MFTFCGRARVLQMENAGEYARVDRGLRFMRRLRHGLSAGVDTVALTTELRMMLADKTRTSGGGKPGTFRRCR